MHPTHSPRPFPTVRVILADSMDLFRIGIGTLLAQHPALTVVGEVAEVTALAPLCQLQQPDLVLLDTPALQHDVPLVLQALTTCSRGTRVLVITLDEHPETVCMVLAAGARGYLTKATPAAALLDGIRQVLRGDVVVDPRLALRALQCGLPGMPAQPERLTPRERDVLRLLAQGQTNREIASRLVLSVGTVKIHVEHILAKLGAADRTQAAVRAVEHGLI